MGVVTPSSLKVPVPFLAREKTELQCSEWHEWPVWGMFNTAMCWPVVPYFDAVINAVIYWPVRCLSPHLAEAWEGQWRLSALPEGRGAVIWAAFQCPRPASPPTGDVHIAGLLCPEEEVTHAGVKWDQEGVLCGVRSKWRNIHFSAHAYLLTSYTGTVFYHSAVSQSKFFYLEKFGLQYSWCEPCLFATHRYCQSRGSLVELRQVK